MQLLGSGTIFREVIAAAELLQAGLGRRRRPLELSRASTSSRATASDVARWNLLHPTAAPKRPLRRRLPRATRAGRSIAATDYMRALRRADPRLRAAPLHRRSAPTASAAPTRARSCATSSRSTATTSPSRRSRRWPTTARCRSAKVAEAITKYGDRSGEAGAVDRTERRGSPCPPSKSRFPTSATSRTSRSSRSSSSPAMRCRPRIRSSRSSPTRRRWTSRRRPRAAVRELRVRLGDKVAEGVVVLTLETADGGAGETAGAAPALPIAARRQRRWRLPRPATPAPRTFGSSRSDREPVPRRPPRRAAHRRRPPAAMPGERAPPRRRHRRLQPVASDQAFAAAHASPSVRRFARELGVILRASRAPVRRGGSGRRTCRHSSSRRWPATPGLRPGRRPRSGGRRARPAALADGGFLPLRSGGRCGRFRASGRSPAPISPATG